MQQKNKLEIFTFGIFDFELLSEDEKNIIYTFLLSNILEIHKDKKSKKLKRSK